MGKVACHDRKWEGGWRIEKQYAMQPQAQLRESGVDGDGDGGGHDIICACWCITLWYLRCV